MDSNDGDKEMEHKFLLSNINNGNAEHDSNSPSRYEIVRSEDNREDSEELSLDDESMVHGRQPVILRSSRSSSSGELTTGRKVTFSSSTEESEFCSPQITKFFQKPPRELSHALRDLAYSTRSRQAIIEGALTNYRRMIRPIYSNSGGSQSNPDESVGLSVEDLSPEGPVKAKRVIAAVYRNVCSVA